MKEEEEAPILRLEILQGPRQGETLDFKPGSAVRIGRLVKGNNLPIKDPGISSQHLSILNESAKWILRDLDSSNGTVLDASQIPPNTPFTLHHDSTIKIGELTSIHVVFITFDQQQEHALPPRRNPTRRGRTAPVPAPAPVSVPAPAPVSVPAPSKPARGRGRPRGRGVKVKEVQSFDENDENVVNAGSERVDPPASPKRERIMVKESSVENLIRAEEKVDEPKSTQNPSLFEISDSSDENLVAPVVEEPKNARGTRSSKNTRGVTANIEKKTKRGVAGKRELEKERLDGNGMKEACDGKETGNLNEDDGNWPDLNKMTLGEWFDFLEVYLPKQIINETEEMIDSMTQKAERLRKYIAEMQQQNPKDKMPTEK